MGKGWTGRHGLIIAHTEKHNLQPLYRQEISVEAKWIKLIKCIRILKQHEIYYSIPSNACIAATKDVIVISVLVCRSHTIQYVLFVNNTDHSKRIAIKIYHAITQKFLLTLYCLSFGENI